MTGFWGEKSFTSITLCHLPTWGIRGCTLSIWKMQTLKWLTPGDPVNMARICSSISKSSAFLPGTFRLTSRFALGYHKPKMDVPFDLGTKTLTNSAWLGTQTIQCHLAEEESTGVEQALDNPQFFCHSLHHTKPQCPYCLDLLNFWLWTNTQDFKLQW